MTNERKHPDGIDESDEHVSRTYRELADERTPARLDKKVLRQAARAARPPYAKSIMWTKPVAWAATIAICLAITLQVTQVPMPEGVPAIMPVDSLEEDDANLAEELPIYSLDSPAPATGVTSAAMSETPDTAEPKRSMLDAAPAEDRSALKQRAVEREQADTAPSLVMPTSTGEFEAQDLDILQRAEDMVRLQSGPNKAAEQVAAEKVAESPASLFAVTAADRSEPVSGCDEEAKARPETWHACILSLDEAGMPEIAARMRKQLAEAFPDFEAP